MLVVLSKPPYYRSVKDGFIVHKMYRVVFSVENFDTINLVDFMTGEILPKPILFSDVRVLTDKKEMIQGMFSCVKSYGKIKK